MFIRPPKPLAPSPATQSGPAHVLCFRTTTPEGIARGISGLQSMDEAYRIPLLRAVPRRQIALTVLGTGQAPPLSKLDDTRLPAVVVLVDDDDTTRLGPDGWPYARRIMRWARGAMLHGTGGQAEHYELAVEGAQRCGRLILVETSSAQLGAWADLARRTIAPESILVLRPPAGGVHPIPVPRDRVN